jgi:hypothetical protein
MLHKVLFEVAPLFLMTEKRGDVGGYGVFELLVRISPFMFDEIVVKLIDNYPYF